MAYHPACKIAILEVVREKLGLAEEPLRLQLNVRAEDIVTIEIELPIEGSLDDALATVVRRFALTPLPDDSAKGP